jgi:hypothetical protein
MLDAARQHLAAALTPETWQGAAWSAKDCQAALRAIAASRHAAVPCAALAAQLGRDGAAALAALQRHGVLRRRAYHALLQDMPAAAFGQEPRDDVLTLPSAAHLLAARQLLQRT